MNLCQLNTFFLTFWPVCCVWAANRPKVRNQVFNSQRFICTKCTSYKIHILEITFYVHQMFTNRQIIFHSSSFALKNQCALTCLVKPFKFCRSAAKRQQSWCHFYDFISFNVCDRMSCEESKKFKFADYPP